MVSANSVEIQETKKQTRQEKVDALYAEIEEGVKALLTSSDWKTWLRFQRRFHRYSWSNQLLIFQQAPFAKLCAGYRTWQKQGRQVLKGQSGIRILAPMTGKDDDGDRKVFGFRAATVFDVTQTEGDEIPKDPTNFRLQGGALREKRLVEHLGLVATELGFHIQYEENYFVLGSCSLNGEPTITLRAGLAPLEELATLAHEIGHGLMHQTEDEGERVPRREAEVEAESFAYAALSAYDVNIGGSTFPYVAHWSGGKPEMVKGAMQRVGKALKAFCAAEDEINAAETH